MTDYIKLYKGIGRAAWGYFFVYFDLKFNAVSFTPSFIGFLLLLSAIDLLSEEERELNLLHTLGAILTVWNLVSWLASFAAIDLDGLLHVVDIVIGVSNIYFHFQFVTNLASIAAKYQSEGQELDAKLLAYRSVQTVMHTVAIVLINLTQRTDFLGEYTETIGVCATIVIAIMYLLITVLLMKALFELRKCLA